MADKHPNAPRGHTVGTGWPAWRYGPNEQAAVFQTEADVPVGWCSRQDRSDPKEAPLVIAKEPQPEPAEAIAVDTPAYARPAEPDARPNRRHLTLKRTPG